MAELSKVLRGEGGNLHVVSDEGRGFAERVLFGERLPDNIKELERRGTFTKPPDSNSSLRNLITVLATPVGEAWKLEL